MYHSIKITINESTTGALPSLSHLSQFPPFAVEILADLLEKGFLLVSPSDINEKPTVCSTVRMARAVCMPGTHFLPFLPEKLEMKRHLVSEIP